MSACAKLLPVTGFTKSQRICFSHLKFSVNSLSLLTADKFIEEARRCKSTNGHTIKNNDEITTFEDGKRPTHVIVGGGSAGCVLANRLSEQAENRVLLLEAGPKDAWWNWKIHMPAALMYNLMNDKYNWYYHTVPQKHVNDRVMYWPRGRVLGGSSALNAMCYVRGHALDYDRWVLEGAEGWSYAACLPYFKKSQRHEKGPDTYRGGSGPLGVTGGRLDRNPLYQAFVDAGVQAGYGYTEDPNGYRQEGFGAMDLTVWKGIRMSTSRAYLRPVQSRKNLKIMTGAFTRRLLFDGYRAVGVEIDYKGKTRKIFTDLDIVLCGGAINTPQLLMLSGIGPKEELKKHGIEVKQDMPGVGANLQDHLEIYIQQKSTKPVTLYNQMSWKFPHNMIKTGLTWFLTQKGLGATNHFDAGAFTRSSPDVPHPDIQYHFLPGTVHDHGRKPGFCHAFQLHAYSARPTSKGTITLKSKDPRDHPYLDPNYLATEEDRVKFRVCVRQAREIFLQKAFDNYRGEELSPGREITSDADIDAFLRAQCDSAYHPSCTCKMGYASDSLAVVDGSTMKVHGTDGLRVVDASIMPSIVSGNLNATVIMMAERAADLIQELTLLEPENALYWKK